VSSPVITVLRRTGGGKFLQSPLAAVIQAWRLRHDPARLCASQAVFDQAPVAVVAASAPDVLAELAQAVLGSLNQLPDDERQLLIGTLRTWLACGGSTDATAKALYCHPNTVRYRLNRVTEHTGRSLTDPQAVTELSLALQADFLAQSVQPPAYARRS
jgi:DNA-binding PucR family transcriptional regulator